MDCEIYLKRGPWTTTKKENLPEQKMIFVEPSQENLWPPEKIREWESGRKSDVREFSVWREDLKKIDRSESENLNYSGISSFWTISQISDKGITMQELGEKDYLEYLYNSRDELKRDFIDLSSFLDQATFVGRRFKRTEGLKNGDNTYTFDDNLHTNAIALYLANDTLIGIKLKNGFPTNYCIIDSRYLKDGKYTFSGPVYEEYQDKERVYRGITEQLGIGEQKSRGRK